MEGTPPPQGPPPGPAGPGDEEPELTEEQLEYLRQMEEEMKRVRIQDVVAQSTVSILNLAARRIAKEDERDLEQARVGIEAVRALVDLLEPDAQHEVKNALSQLQMMYAQEAGTEVPPASGGGGSAPPTPQAPQGPGGSGLWTPGS